MASTDDGAAFTEAQRFAQVRLRAVTARDALRVWQMFDPADITKSWAKLEPVLVAMIQSRQPLSAKIAARYLTEFRRAELVAGSVVPSIPDIPLADDLIPNLRIVGPANAWKLVDKGAEPAEIGQITFSNVEGEMVRQILNGGRKTIVGTVERDDQAEGWARVTDGAPCSFCALLAGRGPIYKSEWTSSFDAHRKCGCTGEPVYDRANYQWPASAAKWADLYDEVAFDVRSGLVPDGRGSKVIRREFRRRYEARQT